jgi:hypothetical protein
MHPIAKKSLVRVSSHLFLRISSLIALRGFSVGDIKVFEHTPELTFMNLGATQCFGKNLKFARSEFVEQSTDDASANFPQVTLPPWPISNHWRGLSPKGLK